MKRRSSVSSYFASNPLRALSSASFLAFLAGAASACFGGGIEGGADALASRFSGLDGVTVISPSSVTLKWTQQSDYSNYTIFGSFQDTPLVTIPVGSSYTVTGLSAGTTYSFSVSGTSSKGLQYGNTKQKQATTWPIFLGPTVATPVDSSSIALTWSGNEGPNYWIYYTQGTVAPTIYSGSPPTLLPPQATTTSANGYTVGGLSADTTYTFMVVASYPDETDSFHLAQGSSGSLTAQYVTEPGFDKTPVISTASVATTLIPPLFQVTGSPATYQTTFALYRPGSTPLPLGSIYGNGPVTSAQALPVGVQTVLITITDSFSGATAYAQLSGIVVQQSAPNGGLLAATATTSSSISPAPTVTTNPISLGYYPLFTVSGGQPGYVTKIYDPSTTPATVVASITGDGSSQALGSSPLSRGPHTLYALVSYNGSTLRIDGINVNVRALDSAPVSAPTLVNNGVGMQGFGRNMAVGDFNCDGRPDLAVGAPFSTGGVYIYYGSSSGLDTSVAPSTNPAPGKPLFIKTPANFAFTAGNNTNAGITSSNRASGSPGAEFGISLAAGNFNGDINPSSLKACTDLAVGADGATLNGNNNGWHGLVMVYYGSPSGIQVTPSYNTNAFACASGSSSCSTTLFYPNSMGLTYGSAFYTMNFGTEGYGAALAAGDIDGDGYDDLVASVPNGDPDLYPNQGGYLILHRGSGNGLTPSFTPVKLPIALTEIGGTASAHSQFGLQVAIGHFVTSVRGAGAADIAVSFSRLSTDATGLGVTSPATQSGVVVIPGSTVSPFVAINPVTFFATTYYKVMPPMCNTAVGMQPTGWNNNTAGGICGAEINSLLAVDVNNDGYDDLVFSNSKVTTPVGSTGAIFVYPGGPSVKFITRGAQSTIPTLSATCVDPSLGSCAPQAFYLSGSTRFGNTLGFLGDTNNDGISDLGVGAMWATVSGQTAAGLSYIYHGTSSGLSSTGMTTVNPSKAANSYFGSAIVGAKFSDPTGFEKLVPGNPTYNDIAIGSIGESPSSRVNGVVGGSAPAQKGLQGAGTVSVFSSTLSGLPLTVITPSVTMAPDNVKPDQLGADQALIAGDLDGDGFAEVVTRVALPGPLILGPANGNGSPVPSTQTGFVVYYGSSSGLITSQTVAGVTTQIVPSYTPVNAHDPLLVSASALSQTATPFSSYNFATTIEAAGDTNGDGYADLMVADKAGAIMIVFYGSPSGLIVSPTPVAAPYAAGRGLNPLIVANTLYTTPTNVVVQVAVGMWGTWRTHGDFNGDGYSDLAFYNDSAGKYFVIYGSKDIGLVSDGIVYDTAHVVGTPPDTNKSKTSANCSGTPLICTPFEMAVPIGYAGRPVTNAIYNAGDMDGDGTDDLVSVNSLDSSWNTTAGVVRIYYGSKSVGISASIYVDLRIDPLVASRWLGGYVANLGAGVNGAAGPAGDVNGDGLMDFALTSYQENSAYLIYGVPGNGSSPTASAGPYIQQGLCTTYPCQVNVTTSGSPDYQPNHVIDASASQTASCSPALRSCSVLRWTVAASGTAYGGAAIFSPGDMTGDKYSDVVFERNNLNIGTTTRGSFYVYSGSVSGLQVSGTPSARPICVNGACAPYMINPPNNIPVPLNVSSTPITWYSAPYQNFGDVDGDGKKDFLISNAGYNGVDGAGNVTMFRQGIYYLFH